MIFRGLGTRNIDFSNILEVRGASDLKSLGFKSRVRAIFWAVGTGKMIFRGLGTGNIDFQRSGDRKYLLKKPYGLVPPTCLKWSTSNTCKRRVAGGLWRHFGVVAATELEGT